MKQISVLIFSSIFLLSSCKNDDSSVNLDKVTGHWEIVNAYRNGAITESVDEGYFKFGKNKVFETNIPGLPNGQSFEFKDGILMIKGDTCHYRFSNVTDSVAVVDVIIREMPFQFELKKK